MSILEKEAKASDETVIKDLNDLGARITQIGKEAVNGLKVNLSDTEADVRKTFATYVYPPMDTYRADIADADALFDQRFS